MHTLSKYWSRAAAVLFASAAVLASGNMPLAAQESADGPIPMGTTKGERYNRLVLQNAMIISGRGTPGTNRGMPPEGPVDIVIEGNRIVDIVLNDPVNARSNRSQDFRPKGDKMIDVKGMYVIPGLVDMHTHLPQGTDADAARELEYSFRMYMGHGVTTLRDAGNASKYMQEQRRLSSLSQVVAPRLVLCQRWPLPLTKWNVGNTPDKARAMVRQFKELGADCIKISKSPGQYPDVMEAAVDEGKKLGLHTMVDLKVSETDARTAMNAGVLSIEHFYGFPEAGLTGSQTFPVGYNYWDEKDRFSNAGKLWQEGDKNPEKIVALLDELIKKGTNWNPTMSAYEDGRDLFRARSVPFRETLILPGEIDMLPDSTKHGSFHAEWKLSDELNWRQFYQIWFKYVKLFHDKGGLLTVGSDNCCGIGEIRELEMMQEAGIPAIDVIKLATTNAYQVLGMKDNCGVRVGCMADLAVVNGNPIENFKVMYGRGYGYYGILPKGEREKVGGVKWTVKDGVIYDAQALLREVEWMVQQEKQKAGFKTASQ